MRVGHSDIFTIPVNLSCLGNITAAWPGCFFFGAGGCDGKAKMFERFAPAAGFNFVQLAFGLLHKAVCGVFCIFGQRILACFHEIGVLQNNLLFNLGQFLHKPLLVGSAKASVTQHIANLGAQLFNCGTFHFGVGLLFQGLLQFSVKIIIVVI